MAGPGSPFPKGEFSHATPFAPKNRSLPAVCTLAATSRLSAADLDDRQALLGRQKIRLELAEAMADGHLKRSDQYRILLDAKDVLRPEDLPGLERTLDRLASGEEAVPTPAKKPAAEKQPAEIGPITGGEVIAQPAPIPLDKQERAVGKPSPFVEDGDAAGPNVQPEPFYDVQPGDPNQPPPEEEDDFGPGLFDGRLACLQQQLFGTRPIYLDLFSGVDGFKGPMDYRE